MRWASRAATRAGSRSSTIPPARPNASTPRMQLEGGVFVAPLAVRGFRGTRTESSSGSAFARADADALQSRR